MENYWTEMEVDKNVTLNHYKIYLTDRNVHYGNDGKRFVAAMTYYSRRHPTLSDTTVDAVADLMKTAEPRIVVIFKACDSELMDVMSTLKNCVAVAYRGSRESKQHHIYAIEWAPALAVWYARAHTRSELEYLPDNIWLAVDGKVTKLESMCKTCDGRLKNIMHLCHFLHHSCTRTNYAPLSWDFIAGGNRNWFDAHQPHYDALGTLALNYKPVKELSVHDAFTKPSFDSLSCDHEEWAKRKDELSSRSTVAATTRRVRSSLCQKCTHYLKGRKVDADACSSGGGRKCRGPMLEEDLRYGYVSNCEPWMLHALLLCGRKLDMRKFVPVWKGHIIKDYRILGPTSFYAEGGAHPAEDGLTSDRPVLVAKVGLSLMDHAIVSYEGLVRFAGEKEVDRFAQLQGRAPRPKKVDRVNGLVTDAVLMATAYAMAKNNVRYWRPVGAVSSRELTEVRIVESEIHLQYSLARSYGDTIRVRELNDIYRIPGCRFARDRCESPYRKRENELWREAVINRGVTVTADVWRRLFSEQNWMSADLPSEKELKKLVRAMTRKVKKENEENRRKEADAKEMKKLTAKAAGIAS